MVIFQPMKKAKNQANRVAVQPIELVVGEDSSCNSQREAVIVAQQRSKDAEFKNSGLLDENTQLKEIIESYRSVDAESRVAELECANRQMAERLLAIEKRYSLLQLLLDQRTQELKDAQIYLNKPDEFPGSSIVKNVEAINSEMFNTAMSIVDLYERYPKLDLEETFVQEIFLEKCRQVAKSAIGELLYSANCQIDEAILHRLPIVPEDSMPLQLALQYVLVKWAMRAIGIPGIFPGKDAVTDLYELVRTREPQSVSSQWRLIGYKTCPPEVSTSTIFEEIMSILCICGLSSRTLEYQSVQENVRKRISNMDRSLLALRRAIHEGITSSDMEVCIVDPGTPYDSRTMADTAETMSASNSHRVLCTVGLGLKRTTTKKTAHSKGFYLHTELLKRPQVALVGLLECFGQPIDADFDAYLSQDK